MGKHYAVYICLLFILLSACKKSAFLAAVPDKSLVIPQSLSDFQAILDNDTYMNGSSKSPGGITPDFEESGTDDYYANNKISTLDIAFTNLYVWEDDIYSHNFQDWAFPYRCIFYANTVLDGIGKLTITAAQKPDFYNATGSALFYRAHMFYHLAQVFAPVYDSASAATDWGIPLRLTSDINEPIQRATVQQTYEKIITDLATSVGFLPASPLYKTRPCKAAAYGLLSKVYLSMRDYTHATLYADSALQLQGTLLDYNTLSTTATLPFARFNADVIFHSVQILNSLCNNTTGCVDSVLYNSYDSNDLRKSLFYKLYPGTSARYFRGSYDGTNYFFSGIAADELYLIRAEGNARAGNVSLAMEDLNILLQKRWKAGTYVALAATSPTDAINQILAERRKELAFRGTRWTDLRRLNKEGGGIAVSRLINGQAYTLAPNSLYYTFLIPPSVITFNPDMPQNPR